MSDQKPKWREEEWLTVVGFDTYEVSSIGNVRGKMGFNLKTQTPRRYKSVSLRDKDGKSFARTIHRLVAEAFIPNPEKKPQVNHINGIKLDNRIENLEWVTFNANMDHAKHTGLIKSMEENPNSKLTLEQAREIRDRCDAGENMSDIAREFGVNKTTIHKIHRRESWKGLRKESELLAEIESLRAENAELKSRLNKSNEIRAKFRAAISDSIPKIDSACDERDELQTKLSAATAQLEKMAETITAVKENVHTCDNAVIKGQLFTVCRDTLAQYEQFKKELNNT